MSLLEKPSIYNAQSVYNQGGGGGFDIDNIGGRVYSTVVIDGKSWMAENLDFKFSGVDIGPAGSPETPAAWYYNNDESTYGENGNKYGLLYNWHAVKYLNDNKSTLCPGWHVPTSTEWDALATSVGGASTAGTKLKSTTGWFGNGTNDYGFAAFPAGYRSNSFRLVGNYAGFWTITDTYYRYFNNDAAMVQNTSYKYYGFSVRLVKDA